MKVNRRAEDRDVSGPTPHEESNSSSHEDQQRRYNAWLQRRLPHEESNSSSHEDRSPGDVTRAAACKDPQWAYLYARDVDQGPRDDTRAAACKNPFWAYLYAKEVDKGPRDDTRAAACESPKQAYDYARYVDNVSRVARAEAEG